MILLYHSWAHIQRNVSQHARDASTLFVIATLFTKPWNKSRCPTTNEWIKKMWYIYTMEY
jgi:hypothetical protein